MNGKSPSRRSKSGYDKQIALVLQGGGALGSYQAGVYEAIAEHGYLPDWVAGISIGAINSAIRKRAARSCRKTSHILGAGFVTHGELARSAVRRLAGLDAAAERVVCADVRPAGFFPAPAVLRRPAT